MQPEIEKKGPRIIEVAHGVSQRNHFINLDKLGEWRKEQLDIDLYSSFFRFYTKDPYTGGVLASFGMDFDCADNPKKAQREALTVCKYLIQFFGLEESGLSISFSGGKGIHVFVNHRIFGIEPYAHLPQVFKDMAKYLIHEHGLKTLDLAIYDRRRLVRLQNSRHESGLYKIPLTLSELETLKIDQIKVLAIKPRRPFQKVEYELSKKARNWYKKHLKKFQKWLVQRKEEFIDSDFEVGDIWPCVKKRLETGAKKGERNACTWQLGLYFNKKGVPLDECLSILKAWYGKIEQPLGDYRKWKHCEKSIKYAYGPNELKIGCGSVFIKEFCVGKENCPHYTKIEETVFSKEALEKAEQILSQDPLEYIAETINLIHVGDRDLLKIAYISALSAQLSNPLHLWPIGTSQTGKSHSLYSTRHVLPKELYNIFTSASPKALFYYAKKYGENCFDGKLIFIDEIEASKLTLPMLRSLTSPTDIEPRHLSVYDADLLDLKIKGPRTIWFTSVKAFGADQLRNRFIFVNPDESEKQDSYVFSFQKNETLKPNEKEEFQIAQAITKKILETTENLKVQIPYINKIVWPYQKRRWLFPVFRSFIEVIAKIHFKHREHDTEKIVSTPADFNMAKKLWKTFLKTIIYRASETARAILKELPEGPPDSALPKTTADLTEKIHLSTRQIHRLLEELEEAQLINKRKRQTQGPGRLAWEYWKTKAPNVKDIKLSDEEQLCWLMKLDDLEVISDINDIRLEPVKIKIKKMDTPKPMSEIKKQEGSEKTLEELKQW